VSAPRAPAALPPAGTPFPLRPSQERVLELVARGLSDREIARQLGLSHRTVRTHLDDVYDATGERGRARCAVLWALAHAGDRGEER